MTIHRAPEGFSLEASSYSTGTIGATSELIACAELMRLGYHVYRCESPAAPFDVVAYRDGKCLRVEVKSVTFKALIPQFTFPTNDEWDLLAVVGREADVLLFAPEMPRAEVVNVIRAHYGYPPIAVPERPQCGSMSGYERHRRLRESCERCWETMRQYHRDRRAALAGGK